LEKPQQGEDAKDRTDTMTNRVESLTINEDVKEMNQKMTRGFQYTPMNV
jgi:hypothetical protein